MSLGVTISRADTDCEIPDRPSVGRHLPCQLKTAQGSHSSYCCVVYSLLSDLLLGTMCCKAAPLGRKHRCSKALFPSLLRWLEASTSQAGRFQQGFMDAGEAGSGPCGKQRGSSASSVVGWPLGDLPAHSRALWGSRDHGWLPCLSLPTTSYFSFIRLTKLACFHIMHVNF